MYLRSVHAPVGDASAHAGNHADAAGLLEADHLASCGLGSHEAAGDVDAQDPFAVLGGMVETRRFEIDASGSDEAVKATLVVGNALHDPVQLRNVSNIRLVVCEGGAQLSTGALFHFGILGVCGRWRQAINDMHWNRNTSQILVDSRATVCDPERYN